MGKSNRELYRQHLDKKRQREETEKNQMYKRADMIDPTKNEPKERVRISFGKNDERAEKTPADRLTEESPRENQIRKVAETSSVPKAKVETEKEKRVQPRGKVPQKKEKVPQKKEPSHVASTAERNTAEKSAPTRSMERFEKNTTQKKPSFETWSFGDSVSQKETTPKKASPTSRKATSVQQKPVKKPSESPKRPISKEECPVRQKKRAPHKKKSSIKKVLIALFMVALLSGGAFAVWYFWPQFDFGKTEEKAPAQNVTYGVNFVVGSNEAKKVTNTEVSSIDLNNFVVSQQDAYMIPVSCLKSALELTTTVASDSSQGTISNGQSTLAIIANSVDATVNDAPQKLSGVPFVDSGELYVSVADIASVFGYQTDASEASDSISIFRADIPKKEPYLWFSTDKEVYAPGEPVKYGVMSATGNEPIVEYRWENKQERFFTPGEYTITMQGKDIFGRWSDVKEQKIQVSGAAYAGASKVPVLMYHYFTAEQGDTQTGGKHYGNGTVMWVGQFREEMKYLKDNGYQTLFVSELMSYLDNGQAPPPKSVVVICDDGYENNYTQLYPVIKEMNIKANIAVIVHASEGRVNDRVPEESRHLTFPQMKEMMESGLVEIGSHTFDSHIYYAPYSGNEGFFLVQPTYRSDVGRTETTAEYQDRVENDLARSKVMIQKELGIEKPFFVYPYGRENDFIQKTLKNLGYSSGFVIRGTYAKPGVNLFEIPRFGIPPTTTLEEFAKIIGG